ncbi:MAG: hypothetical protein EBW79_06180, partial [Actinobacteria bacterium]|nr:hypothetical protein [Actinomycetota bacterium]
HERYYEYSEAPELPLNWRQTMTLKHLLAAGYLKSGDSIIWKRRALKRSHLASIQSDGTIVTDDGVVHKTPSGAAKHLNDDKPVDGWLAWKLEESGVSLSDLRKRLN